ncbi:MAG: HRDC domain-containing protein, partial [Geodermatophilaceae bacterium]|nr:HRDC domain-containing protein [Geodermatophilaceae bacterium]
ELAGDLADALPDAGLPAFVAELEERASAQHAPTVQGVTLASLHAAKGLEWDAVFLVGLTDGTMPLQHATTEEEVEEERRLLYVGITRAREHLQLSWAASRAAGGRRARRPSRFLPSTAVADRPTAGRTRTAPVCRICGQPLRLASERTMRRCAECPADYDEALFERLRTWRSAQAGERKVPAYVVFSDATLTAIAQARPSSVPQLLAVPGIGSTKLDLYGDDVLALVRGELTV